MTIEELKTSEKVFLTLADISPIIGCTAQSIRNQAKRDPSKLGFAIVQIGTRIRVPRDRFLRFIGVLSEIESEKIMRDHKEEYE